MIMRSSWLAIAVGVLGVFAHDANAQGGAGAQIPQQMAAPRSPAPTPGQPVESCIAGRIFGITEFVCTQCGMSSPRDSTHVVYSFGTEPIVIETDNPASRIRPGDKIVAVNGNPITTRAGADNYADPPVGTASITVRRNNVNITFDQLVSSARYCPAQGFRIAMDSLGGRFSAGAVMAGARGGGAGGGGGGGRGGARQGGAMIRTDSIGLPRAQIDSLNARMRIASATARGNVAILRTPSVEPVNATVQNSSLGLTFKCQPICTQTRTRDGATQYWRFDAFPIVTNVTPGSLAAKAGLRDGDLLISVNGVSPQVEEGALLLNRANTDQPLQLEVRRGEKVEKITVKS